MTPDPIKAKLPDSPMGCPMDRMLRLLMGQWTSYILWMLATNGPMRFGALKRSVPGLSSKVLTERLRFLEESHVIFRDHVPTIPPKVTYGLTERGQELVSALNELFQIGKRWCEEDEQSRDSQTVCPSTATLQPEAAEAIHESQL